MEATSNNKPTSPPNGITVTIPDFSHLNGHQRPADKPLIPEYWKTLWSYGYMNLVVFIMCYATVITHREAPDRRKHPPLPDRFMDNLPNITWGIMGSEVCIMVLGLTLLVMTIFHKHRTIVFRRFCIILATVYIMRISTMLSTALPVLPPPNECTKQPTDTYYEQLALTFSLWMKSGSRLSGIKMCGDYMFSGHITSLTLANLMIIEYSPSNFYVLRYFSISLNVVGSYILIVGRGHYTVDVIIAIILVFIVFHFYHTLTSLYVFTKSSDKLRWFPFFWYFERNVCCAVPNEFEVPRLSHIFSGKI
ncbi:sphingomyelin synthase-related protein 1-like [Strongylocentrotus purpuratus]|uniref:Sphingomyelin synthase-like domain-containing protein n=1 Tax=Strongylocentrotus purpuratus TaxID=7668 RepID=A0A7M7NXH4_STRPU|nr:sphingomyelin synthase-related protein 1-like [Strongylocentrotus purpuratus]